MEYPFEKTIEIQDGEYFRGGVVANGLKMPLGKESNYFFDINATATDNQVNGLFVSTHGRFVYASGDYSVCVKDGVLRVLSSAPIYFGKSDGTLRGGYLAAMQYAKTETPHSFPRDLLLKPQFCTWVEMGINVTQEKILDYADKIVANGFPHHLLIIDDGWSVGYGDWRFDERKIPDPKGMIQALHAKGFQVSLWIVPFVDETAKDYETLKANGAFVCTPHGEVKKTEWWNGVSAVLDLTSPYAREYLEKTLDGLQRDYGVDGFKLDAGDAKYYACDDKTHLPTTPAQQCALFSEVAKRYSVAEVRSGFLNGGSHLITRLGDKRRSWEDDNGIRALVPNMIQAGLSGYPFSCADMIGGGNIVDFDAEGLNELSYDEQGNLMAKERATSDVDDETELAVRFCQCNALMPAMQFSCAYWDKNAVLSRVYKDCIDLHGKVGEYMNDLITRAVDYGEPILRCVEYEFPHQGFEKENDAFFLGDKYYVLPVIEKGVTEITARLPHGAAWKYAPTGEIFEGGQSVKVAADLYTLPYFERTDERKEV